MSLTSLIENKSNKYWAPFYGAIVLFFSSLILLSHLSLRSHILEPCIFILFVLFIISMHYIYPNVFILDEWKLRKNGLWITLFSTLGIMGLLGFYKWTMILPHVNILNGRLLVALNDHTIFENLIYIAAYAVSCPFQEWFARGIIQKQIGRILPYKFQTVGSLFIASGLFAIYHSYISLLMVGFAFLLGLYWGWLYHYYRSLLMISISHIMIGIWALYIVGIDGIFT